MAIIHNEYKTEQHVQVDLQWLMNITEICFLQHKESTKDFRTFLSNLHFIFTSFRLLDVLISQGIDHLDFRPDKFGNQDIVGMVSAEEEVRPYLLYYLYYLHIYNIIYTAGGGILQHHLPGGRQGNGGEMAAAGWETDDKVSARHDREVNVKLLQHSPHQLGPRLAWPGRKYLILHSGKAWGIIRKQVKHFSIRLKPSLSHCSLLSDMDRGAHVGDGDFDLLCLVE